MVEQCDSVDSSLLFEKVCDGVPDCPNGEDESVSICQNYTCTNHFRCKSSINCLSQEEYCDGVKHCKDGEDEAYCAFLQCPVGCRCNGYIIECEANNMTRLPYGIQNTEGIRALFFSQNELHVKSYTFKQFSLLVELDISRNGIRTLPSGVFSTLNNVRVLNLSFNHIQKLVSGTFKGLHNLKVLNLVGNPLEFLEAGTFTGLQSKLLHDLDLHFLKLSGLLLGSMHGLEELRHLNLSHNFITKIANGVFKNMTQLVSLDFRGNPNLVIQQETLSGLRLQSLYFDKASFCCFASDVSDECLPLPDEFSTCKDLLANSVLQVIVWVLGVLAVLGNTCVIIWWLRNKQKTVQSILMANLGISDQLMGVYLLMIATVDVIYKGKYALYADDWQGSYTCKLAGVLSMLSSEMSVWMLVLITTDRLIAVVFWSSTFEITNKMAVVLTTSGWIFWIFISVLPLADIHFLDNFYGHNGVCLPFTLNRFQYSARSYSFAIFIIFNSLAFFYICVAYMMIIKEVFDSKLKSGRKETVEDIKLCKRASIIILTDFLCWAPICFLSILAMADVVIAPDISAWVAVLIVPLNSALNPFLYTMSQTKNAHCCVCFTKSKRNNYSKTPKLDKNPNPKQH